MTFGGVIDKINRRTHPYNDPRHPIEAGIQARNKNLLSVSQGLNYFSKALKNVLQVLSFKINQIRAFKAQKAILCVWAVLSPACQLLFVM